MWCMSEPKVTLSVRIPADLAAWAKEEGVNMNGTLIAALERKRGETDTATRLVELMKRRAFIDSEISHVREVERIARERAADRVHIRNVVVEVMKKGYTTAADLPVDCPMMLVSKVLNERAARGELLYEAYSTQQLSAMIRSIWADQFKIEVEARNRALENELMKGAKE